VTPRTLRVHTIQTWSTCPKARTTVIAWAHRGG
jgi:hypothetical protein